jgi:hypothetical protein
MLRFISKFHVRDAFGNAATPSTAMNSRPTLIPLPLISFQPVLDRNAMKLRLAKYLLALPLPELAHRRRGPLSAPSVAPVKDPNGITLFAKGEHMRPETTMQSPARLQPS